MTERVFPIERRGFVLLKSHTKCGCSKNAGSCLCRIVRFVNCLFAQLRQIEVKQQAPDHPILWGVPETNYLKFFLFQVI